MRVIGIVAALATACATTMLDDAAPAGSSGDVTGGSSGNGTGGTSSDAPAGEPSSGDASGGAAAAQAPYANVVAVTVSGTDGAFTFDVTIESSDIDCSEYADWWEVLGEDGSLVYRRILEHSHTDANGTSDADAPGNTFTRSGGPVAVTADDMVVVRAHMSVGGYNGAVMRGSAAGGFAPAPDIGGDFAAGVERDAPQPDGCEF